MSTVDSEMEDDLRPEYDLRSLRVRKMGSGRKVFGGLTVCLEPDVAEIFPDSESVNEALRFLIRITKENKSTLDVLRQDV
ncbi:MAG: hypothetical protein KDJ54_08945 [Candidatus Competibacteraceae bacterium]|nr:hypothetical protein [Candidatus Competibacteraceae bacterium]